MEAPRNESEGRGAGGRRLRSGLVSVGAALGMTLAGFGLASAQTKPPATEAPSPEHSAPARTHRHGFGHPGKFMGIHGEFTTRAPGGGYQTIATQTGEVTEVSRSSITLRSEDGFSRTYAVDDNTLVNAGNEGITDVKQGDQVHVAAVVSDGNARAVDVKDGTQVRALRGRWAPARD